MSIDSISNNNPIIRFGGEVVIDPGSTVSSNYAVHMTLTNTTADGCLFENNSGSRGYVFETDADFATPQREARKIFRIVDANLGANYGSGATLTPNSVNIAGGVGASDAVLTIGDRRSASGKAMLELHSDSTGTPTAYISKLSGLNTNLDIVLSGSGNVGVWSGGVEGLRVYGGALTAGTARTRAVLVSGEETDPTTGTLTSISDLNPINRNTTVVARGTFVVPIGDHPRFSGRSSLLATCR